MREQCEAGAKVLGVDPITAIYTGDSRSVEDTAFVTQAAAILNRYGARLVIVTHPRGGGNGKRPASSDDLAGGRAFSRLTQCVLWVHVHKPAKDFFCKDLFGEAFVKCNRSIFIAKSRNGPGGGLTIAFNLGTNVRFTEHGIVQRRASAADQDIDAM
jgi:hypothetical protein